MKNKVVKRILLLAVAAAVAAGGISGGIFIRNRNLKAEVTPVEVLNSGYWGDEVSGPGVISNDFFQEVRLAPEAQIKEVCVEEGQEVHAGDKLLELDVSSQQLDFQIKELEVEKLKNKIEIAKNDLKTLKNTKPYEPPVILNVPGEPEQTDPESEGQIPEGEPAEAGQTGAGQEENGQNQTVQTGTDPAGENVPDEAPGYTREELNQMIAEKEQEISDLDLSKRKAELEVEKIKQKQTDGAVYATVDGIVRNLQDKDQFPMDGSPFLTVAGAGGVYVTGSVSEFLLDQIEPGQTVMVSSWETGTSCEAVIREISTYPVMDQGYGEGNQNVSYYPYTAVIEDGSGAEFKNGENVNLNMTVGDEEMESVFIFKGYVRSENGGSYVLKADENSRLVRQYVRTGRIVNGDTIEIISGLTSDDRIAFPYGKTAREGARTVDSEENVY